MRRIIWKYFFVSIFVVTINQTGIIGLPGTVAQTGRQIRKPGPVDIQPRQPITISNPSIVSSTSAVTAPRERRNVGNFFTKLRGSRAITIAYIGGSITAGSGAGNPEKTSYRALVTDWLRRTWPQSEITELNAGIVNTGSLYGALRARRDCIAFKPDLVFVEFAVDDVNDEETPIKKAIEGLIRQLLIVPQPPEVIMLYAAGAKRNARIEWHDAIASHYSIPVINLEAKVWAEIDADRLKAQEFWARGSAPTDLGHKLYADTIIEFLSAQSNMAPTPIERSLPLPLVSDEMNYGEFKAIAEIWHDASWRIESNVDRRLPAKLLLSAKPGSQIEYYFEGRGFGGGDVKMARGHKIRFRRGHEPIAGGRALLAGDAAGLADEFTGEGIFYAVDSGRTAARATLRAMAGDGLLDSYTRDIDAQIMPELRAARIVAYMFYGMLKRLGRPWLFATDHTGLLWDAFFATQRGESTYAREASRLPLLPRIAAWMMERR